MYAIRSYYASHAIFDLKDEDTYWCTADIGWVTGHSYVVYGPLACGATTLMYEGVPTHPGPDRLWDIIERHRVTIFYTAPTAIRTVITSYSIHYTKLYEAAGCPRAVRPGRARAG